MQAAKLKIFVVFLLYLITLTGCKPDIIDVTNIQIQRKGIQIDMQIKNPNFFAITLSDIVMDLYIDNFEFEDVEYTPQIKLKPFSKKYYPVLIDIKPLEHPMESSGALMSLLTQDSTEVKMNGLVTVKTFLGKKRIKFEETIYIKYKK